MVIYADNESFRKATRNIVDTAWWREFCILDQAGDSLIGEHMITEDTVKERADKLGFGYFSQSDGSFTIVLDRDPNDPERPIEWFEGRVGNITHLQDAMELMELKSSKSGGTPKPKEYEGGLKIGGGVDCPNCGLINQQCRSRCMRCGKDMPIPEKENTNEEDPSEEHPDNWSG